jgi:hypothetical protein
MKVKAEIFKGIEYVQINRLPDEQRTGFLESLNRNLVIKILIDGKIVSNCVQYSDYEMWFENVYHNSPAKGGCVPSMDSVSAHIKVNKIQSQMPVSGNTSRTLPAESSK